MQRGQSSIDLGLRHAILGKNGAGSIRSCLKLLVRGIALLAGGKRILGRSDGGLQLGRIDGGVFLLLKRRLVDLGQHVLLAAAGADRLHHRHEHAQWNEAVGVIARGLHVLDPYLVRIQPAEQLVGGPVGVEGVVHVGAVVVLLRGEHRGIGSRALRVSVRVGVALVVVLQPAQIAELPQVLQPLEIKGQVILAALDGQLDLVVDGLVGHGLARAVHLVHVDVHRVGAVRQVGEVEVARRRSLGVCLLERGDGGVQGNGRLAHLGIGAQDLIASETGGLVIDPLSCGDGGPKRFEGFHRALARVLQLAGLGQRIEERLHTCLRCGGLVGIQDCVELLPCTVDGFLTAIAVISDLLCSVDLPLKKGSGLILHCARIGQSLLDLSDRRGQSTEIGFVGLAAQVQGDSVLNGLGMLVNLGLWTRKGLVDVVDVIRLAHQLERGPRQVCLVLILLNGFCLLQRGIELRIVGCVGRALLEETVVRGAELRQLRRVFLVLVLYAITVGVGHPVI